MTDGPYVEAKGIHAASFSLIQADNYDGAAVAIAPGVSVGRQPHRNPMNELAGYAVEANRGSKARSFSEKGTKHGQEYPKRAQGRRQAAREEGGRAPRPGQAADKACGWRSAAVWSRWRSPRCRKRIVALGERPTIKLVKASTSTGLGPRLWYGMPGRACEGRQGRLLLSKRAEVQDEVRDARPSCNEANLDRSAMWPTAFALKELTAAEEARIGALVKKAVS